MKTFFVAWICIIVFTTTYGFEVTDDAGQKIVLDHPPARIVSLAPDLTENLFALGLGEKVVGVVKGSNYPRDALKIPIVASHDSISVEKILSLHPDLIVAWRDVRFIPQLKKLNVPIYLNQPHRITDIPKVLRNLGMLTQTSKKAEEEALNFENHLARLKKTFSHEKPVSVFYQIWFNPLMTITHENWINDVITLCGGKNIFENLQGTVISLSREAVILSNPEIIIGSSENYHLKKSWSHYKTLRAVKNQNIYTVDSDKIERPSVRLLQGAEELCQIIDKYWRYDNAT